MQRIKFDFEATKERIYAPNSNVPIGAPVDRNGNIANDGNAYGIVLCKETENEKYWVRYNLVVMVAGYCDIIDAQAIWGDEYSAEAIAAMSGITFCDNHMIPGGSDPAIDNAKATGGIGWTEQGEQTTIEWNGDTTGKTAVGGVFYHISDNLFNWDDLVGGTFVSASGDETSITAELVEQMKTVFQDDNNDVVYLDFFACALADGAEITVESNTLTFPEKGVYFSTGYGTGAMSLTYGTPDTVHKIDPKYIAGGGGGGAFTVEVRFGEDNLIFNHTYAEIDEAKTKISAYIVYPDGAAFPLSVHVTGGVAYFSRIGEIDTVNNTASFYGYVIYEDGTTEYVEKYISLTD